ncbi:AraC-type DNA-binding protein [Flagellimonas taeanensis]|uniref:AraC-type DNA-binding protein n=1 Tax=Flagellimonas taeanensis TaxID=1005926 RepID=A0A1M6X0N4_9FLAO|nr:helix-turn-helix domain-containing protein [Allomuricauda taeanensis]SFB98912.1 AraC-type DNA-binding protein [Allomuricauda taeanensis]SHK99419.1 AraC-type DNA-binding protein [Allomuricauda taeanensis]
MREKTKTIPIKIMDDAFNTGVVIGKIALKDLNQFKAAAESHRDNYHLFFLQEKGTTSIEIDFHTYTIKPTAVIYIHPNQVHRMLAIKNTTVSVWAVKTETLNREYLALLEDITPTKPLSLKKEAFSIISETVSLCIKLSERNHEKLYQSPLKDSCNTLVALVVSQYLAQSKSVDKLSRFEFITKSFKSLLEANFCTVKKPTDYAQTLNISTAYLNECVKKATGYSVSHHIQQRVVLEAKRMLYHSNKSVKEIATQLGYEDYAYFSRLFKKITVVTPSAFRSKNHD